MPGIAKSSVAVLRASVSDFRGRVRRERALSLFAHKSASRARVGARARARAMRRCTLLSASLRAYRRCRVRCRLLRKVISKLRKSRVSCDKCGKSTSPERTYIYIYTYVHFAARIGSSRRSDDRLRNRLCLKPQFHEFHWPPIPETSSYSRK